MEREWKHRGGATLSSVKRNRYELLFCCRRERCGHRGLAQLDALIAKFGGAYPIDGVVALAVCTRCKARWPHVYWYLVPTEAVMKDSATLAQRNHSTPPGTPPLA